MAYKPVGIDENGHLPERARQAIADDAADSSSELGASLNARFGAHIVSVVDFLDGDPMPTATTGDMGALINLALAEAQALADADPDAVYVVGVPAGRFRVTSEVGFDQARSHERVGIRGAGKLDTVFVCVGDISFFHPLNSAQTPGSLSQWACEECVFEGFTVDMTGVTAPDPTGASYKVFKGAGWRQCQFRNIYGFGSPATAFGNDYLVDCVFESCTARDAGRGTSESYDFWANGSRSGFGIATGWSEAESATFIDCHAIDNLRSGFLFEWQVGTSSTQRQRMELIGCSAVGNYMGISASGSGGVYARSSKFNENDVAGVYVGVNEASAVPGRAVELTGCELAGNQYGFFATAVASWGFTPADEDPPECAGGTRIIDCKIVGNSSHGIYARQMPLGAGGFHVIGGQVADNGGSGIRFERAHSAWADVRVRDVDFTGQDRHADLLVPMTAPSVIGNTFRGGDVGIAYHPANTSTDPMQHGNTFLDVTTSVEEAATPLADPAADRSPTTAEFTHHEYLGAESGSWPGAGWLNADLQGGEATWTVTTAGVQPTAGTSGQDALAYRDMGTTATFVEMWLNGGTASQSPARLAVLGYTGPGGDPHTTPSLRQFVGAGVYSSISNYYCLAVFNYTGSGYPTLLWESDIPITDGHTVGIKRAEGSTVTQMFIDGELVHEEDVSAIPATQYAGLYGIYTTAQNNRIRRVDMQALA